MSETIEIDVPGPVMRARVSPEQVNSYLRRTGWKRDGRGYWKWPTSVRLETSGVRPYIYLPGSPDPDVGRLLKAAISQIGEAENRALHEVLAEIAAEAVERIDGATPVID